MALFKWRLLMYILNKLYKQNFFNALLDKVAIHPGFFFIQIGANDGLHADPIRPFILRHKWKGIMVEPQQKYFEKLKKNYENVPGLIFENCAIAETKEIRKLYSIKNESKEPWYNLVASLDQNKGDLKWIRNEMEVLETDVTCLTLEDIILKHGVRGIDLLQIDVEGYEINIINSIDYDKIKPRIIHFEHKHLSYAEHDSCMETLTKAGYKIFLERHETTALLTGNCFGLA